MKIMMSSCLIGFDVMYWGGNFKDESFINLLTSHPNVKIVHFCPEHIMLGTPRNNMLIHGGDGEDIWNGSAQLLDTKGVDLTETMKEGALKMLEFAKSEKPDLIILTEGSDSCGVNVILDPINKSSDGKNKFKPGMGLAASLLKKHGFTLFSHTQVDEIKTFLNITDSN